MTRTLRVIGLALGLALAGEVAAQQDTTRLRGMASENDALVWQAVGRLDAREIGFCTATLIAPDLVLTAAHCVYSKRTGKLLAPEDLTFRAGLRAGAVAAERRVAQIAAHAGYAPADGITAQNVRHDVALLRLAEAIPTSELDPFALHTRSLSSGPVSVVSYGRDRETLPSRQDVCQVLGERDGVLMMDCDVTFGSSGAPVFSTGTGTGRGQIVSVISGMGFQNGRRITYGMTLPSLVADLKHKIWADKPRPVATIRRIGAGDGGARQSTGGAKFVRPGGS